MKLLGGSTSGAGLDVQSQGGTGPTNYAAYFKGNATGADTGGIYAAGGTTGGDGIEAVGTGNGHGLYVVGAGTGEGLHATGGAAANGHGAHFEGVGANSHGLLLTRGGAGGDDLAFGNNDVTVATVTTITNGVTLTDASSDAVIADAVWNAATATYGGSGSYGEKVEALNTGAVVLADASSDAVIADAVWNALTGSYGTANTYGEKVQGLNTGPVTVSSIGNDVITAASSHAHAGQLESSLPTSIPTPFSETSRTSRS